MKWKSNKFGDLSSRGLFQVFIYFLSLFQFCSQNTNFSVWFPRKRCNIREEPNQRYCCTFSCWFPFVFQCFFSIQTRPSEKKVIVITLRWVVFLIFPQVSTNVTEMGPSCYSSLQAWLTEQHGAQERFLFCCWPKLCKGRRRRRRFHRKRFLH